MYSLLSSNMQSPVLFALDHEFRDYCDDSGLHQTRPRTAVRNYGEGYQYHSPPPTSLPPTPSLTSQPTSSVYASAFSTSHLSVIPLSYSYSLLPEISNSARTDLEAMRVDLMMRNGPETEMVAALRSSSQVGRLVDHLTLTPKQHSSDFKIGHPDRAPYLPYNLSMPVCMTSIAPGPLSSEPVDAASSKGNQTQSLPILDTASLM